MNQPPRLAPLLAPLLLLGCTGAEPPPEPEGPPPATGNWRDLEGTWTFARCDGQGRQAQQVAFALIEVEGEAGLRFGVWTEAPFAEPDGTVDVFPGRVSEATSEGRPVAGGEAVGWRALYELMDGRLVATYQWKPAGDGARWLGVAVGECYPTEGGELVWRRLGTTYATSGEEGGPAGLERWSATCFYERSGP